VFLAATMQLPELHVMPDPLARVNMMSYGDGQALNWHFDRSHFTPVRGDTARMIAVFSYSQQPGVMFSDSERMGFFGRVS